MSAYRIALILSLWSHLVLGYAYGYPYGYPRQTSNSDNSEELDALNSEEDSFRGGSLVLSPDLFEGDIITTWQEVADVYGKSVADEVEKAGLLKRAEKIIKGEKEGERRRLGVMSTYEKLWNVRDPDNKVVIPYKFRESISSNEAYFIKGAIRAVEVETGLFRFVERTSEADWILFDNDDGCWSYVGREGGRQTVNVASYCGYGSIIHEICHALGFWHEQSRQDRDEYVTIFWENIKQVYRSNYNKQITDSLGVDYDYGSIMHYPDTGFAKMGWRCKPTKIMNDTVSLISFQQKKQTINISYCFTMIKEKNKNKPKKARNVYLQKCGRNKFANQHWIIEAFDDKSNIIRFADNPKLCITSNEGFGDTFPISVQKCDEGKFRRQKFIFEQKNWKSVKFYWEHDDFYSLQSSKSLSETEKNPVFLKAASNELNNLEFEVAFVSRETGISSRINSFCEIGILKAMDTKGNKVGNRDGLSELDILQLQLLYQCPSGPRNLTEFCTSDCKCRYNQGPCFSNEDCVSGLECEHDGYTMNRCLGITPAPTKKKKKATAPPAIECSYKDKKKCKSDAKCTWIKVGDVNQCISSEPGV